MAGEVKRLHPADIVGAGRAIAGFDARPWLGELGVPAASVVTCNDRAVGPDKQRATAAALGGAVVEVDGGHAACATDPEGLGAAVARAVDLVVAARRPRRDRWRVRAVVRRHRVDEVPGEPAGALDVAV